MCGNGSDSDAILISLKDTGDGRIDYFIPLNFTEERELILLDADNADFDGLEFSGINLKFPRLCPKEEKAGELFGISAQNIDF